MCGIWCVVCVPYIYGLTQKGRPVAPKLLKTITLIVLTLGRRKIERRPRRPRRPPVRKKTGHFEPGQPVIRSIR